MDYTKKNLEEIRIFEIHLFNLKGLMTLGHNHSNNLFKNYFRVKNVGYFFQHAFDFCIFIFIKTKAFINIICLSQRLPALGLKILLRKL